MSSGSFQQKPGPHWGPIVPTGDSAGKELRDPLKCLLRALSKQICVHMSLPHSWQQAMPALDALLRVHPPRHHQGLTGLSGLDLVTGGIVKAYTCF